MQTETSASSPDTSPNLNSDSSAKKPTTQVRSKTDQRYWLDRVKRRTRKTGEATVKESDFSAQISYNGRRERIRLATSNKAEAVARAAAFYRSLVTGGWDEAFESHQFATGGQRQKRKSPASPPPEGDNTTVAALFAAYRRVATPRPSTLATYIKALRKVYSDIARDSGANYFKTHTSGNRTWKAEVDQLPLTTVTTDNLLEWKNSLMTSEACTLDEKRARAITVNSLLRNARSIFAKKHRKLLAKHVTMPDPIPFDEVSLEPSQTPRYRSRINAIAILKQADDELRESKPAMFAALNLALRSGLRRREIDTLMWSSVDLERMVIHVEANEIYDLKSTDSAGEVDIGENLAGFLASFRKAHMGEKFVIPSPAKTRVRKYRSATDNPNGPATPNATTSEAYRCVKLFEKLTVWLRANGVSSKRPIHELRKEIGSLIASEHGVYAASRFLRHSDIRITAATYLDKKKRIIAPI